MPHVAFIESNMSGSGFRAVARARELGYRVTFVTRDPGYYRGPKQPLSYLLDECDHLLTTETNEPDTLIAALARHQDRYGLDGVLSFGEYYLHAAALAARALGLPGPEPAAVALARNKGLARQALAAAGLPAVRFAVVDSLPAARQAAAEIGYPCVVKPVDRSASLNVRLVTGPQALAEQVRAITGSTTHGRGLQLAGEVLIEEYLSGPEFSVETVACRGLIRVVGTTSKRVTGQGAFAEDEAIFPAPALLPWQRRYVESAAVAALRALGLDHGVSHTELKLTGRGPRVVEVNARVGGFPIGAIVKLATGVDLAEAAIRLAVGERPELDSGVPLRAAGTRFLSAPRAGVLTGLRKLAQARLATGVVEVVTTAEPGRLVAPPLSNGDFLGHVTAVGTGSWEVADRLAEVAGAIEVSVAEVRSRDWRPALPVREAA